MTCFGWVFCFLNMLFLIDTMKPLAQKLFSFFVGILIAVCDSGAQDTTGKHEIRSLYTKKLISKIEILAGPGYIRPRGNKYFRDILDFKVGFNAALGISHRINDRFEVNVKFSYEDKGYRFEVYQENLDYNPPAMQRSILENILHYVTCSISPRYTFDKKARFYVSSGPYIGHLIYINGNLISKNGARSAKSLSYETFDVGITCSLGYSLNIKSNLNGTVQFNYNLGLINVSKPITSPMWNTTYTLLLGIAINKIVN
jgi:hypothetical protein